jgi:hypothetical protein
MSVIFADTRTLESVDTSDDPQALAAGGVLTIDLGALRAN